MAAATPIDECGLQMVSGDSRVWESLFGPSCDTISAFENIINNKLRGSKLGKKRKEELNKVGAIILRDCIVDKLNLLIKKASGQTDKQSLRNRIKFYNSPDFIERFTESMPTKTGNIRTKYASYFDLLFNVVSKDDEGWRMRFNRYSDQEQCMRAKGVDKKRFKSVPMFQNKGKNTVCYLCNREILPTDTGSGQKTMECEHILPVSCALSHWWLIKSPTEQTLTPAQMNVLSKEYGWSHRCCNQIKTNSEFIVYDGGKNKYVFNIKLVRTMLHDINTSTNYDCSVANSKASIDINKQLINIQRTVKPLLDKINQNLNNTSSNDMYDLICKLKIISAMSMDSFDSVIANTEINYDGNAKSKAAKKGQITKKRKKLEQQKEDATEKLRTAASKASQVQSRADRARSLNRRKDKQIGTTRKQQGGSAAEQQTETVYDIEEEATKLLNLINSGLDEENISDIEEKYDDLFNNYKYTVFHTNRYGKIVKHKYWIYFGENEDPESVMETIKKNAAERTAAERTAAERTAAERTAAEVSPEYTDNQERWVWDDDWNDWYLDYWNSKLDGWASDVDYNNWVNGAYERGYGTNKKRRQGRKKRNTRRKNQKRKKKRTTMRKKKD